MPERYEVSPTDELGFESCPCGTVRRSHDGLLAYAHCWRVGPQGGGSSVEVAASAHDGRGLALFAASVIASGWPSQRITLYYDDAVEVLEPVKARS